MKRLAVLAALACLAQPAFAGPVETAAWIKTEALRLTPVVEAARKTADARPTLKPAALAPQTTSDLQRFGSQASQMAVAIDKKAGEIDLRCIFRGMAEEADVQLKAVSVAKTGAEQSAALSRLSHMLKDASVIAPAAGALFADGVTPAKAVTAAKATSAAKACVPAKP